MENTHYIEVKKIRFTPRGLTFYKDYPALKDANKDFFPKEPDNSTNGYIVGCLYERGHLADKLKGILSQQIGYSIYSGMKEYLDEYFHDFYHPDCRMLVPSREHYEVVYNLYTITPSRNYLHHCTLDIDETLLE